MQTKETTTKRLTKMGEIGWWLHVDADECKEKIKDVHTQMDVLACRHGWLHG